KVREHQLETWKKPNEYHFHHTFALLFISTFSRAKSQSIRVSFIAFTIGILLFSVSLYLLTVRDILGLRGVTSILVPITPLGGVCFIVGWIGLFVAALKHRA